ncbi:cystatin-1-like [Erythrolamprus reginae]|uniref:cystatin-1-like n=1 Tax=Erythrolamprus reginae TaxID=121349 RepID=UPI00396CCE0F
MGRSGLAVLSLLGLFGALLLLPPAATVLSDVRLTDPRVRAAIVYAVEQHNEAKKYGANYFKGLRLRRPLLSVDAWEKHHLLVLMEETACRKERGRILRFQQIQRCEQLPVNPMRMNCYFRITPQMGLCQ